MCDCEFVEKEVVVPETLCVHYMKLRTYLPPWEISLKFA